MVITARFMVRVLLTIGITAFKIPKDPGSREAKLVRPIAPTPNSQRETTIAAEKLGVFKTHPFSSVNTFMLEYSF